MDLIDYELSGGWDCVYLVPISNAHIGDPRFDRELLEGYKE